MIKLYILPNCPSCEKAREWLAENALDFEERNLWSNPLSIFELKYMLQWLEDGFSEIISVRFKKLRTFKSKTIENLCISDFHKLIQRVPHILIVPLIMDDMRFIIGFDRSKFRLLLPKCLHAAKYIDSE